MDGEEVGETSQGVPCWIVRTTSRTGCIVQIQSTGATIEIDLSTPLDLTRACLVCAIHPVPAVVRLGQFQNNVFRNSELIQVEWPNTQLFPPPSRYQRKKRQPQTESGGTMKRKDMLDRP